MSMNRTCTIYSSICFLTSGDNVLCELRSRYRVIVFLRRYVERKHSIRGLGD
jgi:hypothetical protein